MTDDLRIRNCAGLIYWHLTHGKDDDEAMAVASEHHPELTDDDIRQAWVWAMSMRRLAQMVRCPACGGGWGKKIGQPVACLKCGLRPGKRKLSGLLDDAGVPWRKEQ